MKGNLIKCGQEARRGSSHAIRFKANYRMTCQLQTPREELWTERIISYRPKHEEMYIASPTRNQVPLQLSQ